MMIGWLPWPLGSTSTTMITTESTKPSSPPFHAEDSLVVYRPAATPAADSLEEGTFSTPPIARAIAALAAPAPSPEATATQWCSFTATYGRFAGPCLVVGVLFALAWTVLLLCINIAPTWTVNGLFGTRGIDDGEFWLLSTPQTTHTVSVAFVIASLVLIALYYLYLLFLLCWRRKDLATVDDYVPPLTRSCTTCLCDFVKQHFSALDTESRPYLKVAEEIPDIAYQTVLLCVFMENGLAPGLVIVFSTAVALNCFIRCYRVFAGESYHERNDSFANGIFQYFFAILFPVIQLVRAATAFSFDRTSYAIRVKHFEIGSFERLARFAQPDAFTTAHIVARPLLEMLILGNKTGLAIGVVGMHLALLWRCHDIILGCLLGYKKQRLPMGVVIANDDSFISLLRFTKAVYRLLIKIVLACLCVSKRLIPNVFAVLLFSYGVGVLVVTGVGVKYSKQACGPLAQQCVLHAIEFHGFTGDKYSTCPCIVYVNQPSTVQASWSEWTIRMDATEELRIAAVAGKLQVIQVVNRDLASLPDEVTECINLRELVLIRTALKVLPSWLVDMDDLHVIHLAGDLNSSLSSFPLENEFFSRKSKLRLVRLENLHALTSVPSFPENALPSLRSIVLIDLPKVHSLPVMGHISSLRTLILDQMTSLQRLPLLPDRLTILKVAMPTALCCNGYLGNQSCPSSNATDANPSLLSTQCRVFNAASNTTAECVSSDLVNTTQTLSTQHWLVQSSFHCATSLGTSDSGVVNAITEASVAACDGQMYRECSLHWPLRLIPANGAGGMCLGASRLQIVHCAPKDGRYEKARRAEILARPHACQAESERWLGCRG